MPLPSSLSLSLPPPMLLLLPKGQGTAGALLSGGGSEGLDVLGTKMVSYLDYMDLWVALCSRDAVKVRGGRRRGWDGR